MAMRKRRCLTRALTAGTLAACVLAMAGCGGSSSASSTRSSSTSASASTATSAKPVASSPVASASAGAGYAVSASAGAVTATMHAGTHRPKVQAPWPIHFTVTRDGRAARASVSYEYLLGGQGVARRSHYTFDERFSDVFKWPSAAVGYPLTFRAVIVSEGATIDLDYPVRVGG
jgi:hypothetical protein